jgi:arylsulfatase A-like enzyme
MPSTHPTLVGGKPVSEWIRSFTVDRNRVRGDRPNIIVLFTDEQRWDTIGAAGCPWAVTPNLDRLARGGVLFRNGYTPVPVCVPARHNLLTGLPAKVHGFYDNRAALFPPEVPRLPRLLSEAGYHCGGIGKFHFQPAREHHGFHQLRLMEEIPRCVGDDEFLQFLRARGHGRVRNIHGIRNLLYVQPQRSLLPEEAHGTTWVGDEAVRFIRENAFRPFFLQACWIAPHPPFALPDRWAEHPGAAAIPDPVAPREDAPAPIAESAASYDDPTPGKFRRARELYHRAVWQVDAQVGRILDELDRLGLADNTLVLFTSDHGDMLGDLGAWHKSVPYEGSTHIPLIARFPRRLQPAVRDDFADLNDVLPTCLDAAGVPLPSIPFPGDSLLRDPAQSRRDRTVQYAEIQTGWRRWVMLRDARWKFVHWYSGRDELFDLAADPGERVDLLAGAPPAEAAAAAKRLRAALIAHEAAWGLPGHVVDGEFARFPEPVRDWLPGAKPLEWQFQYYPWAMPEAERLGMTSERDEVLAAVAKEPLTDLSRLDLAFYLSSGGDARLVEDIESRRWRPATARG